MKSYNIDFTGSMYIDEVKSEEEAKEVFNKRMVMAEFLYNLNSYDIVNINLDDEYPDSDLFNKDNDSNIILGDFIKLLKPTQEVSLYYLNSDGTSTIVCTQIRNISNDLYERQIKSMSPKSEKIISISLK